MSVSSEIICTFLFGMEFAKTSAFKRKDAILNESNNTISEVQSFGDGAVFHFLPVGKTDGDWPEFFDEMASVVGIHCMPDLQTFIAICRRGPFGFWSDYTRKAPCHLPEAGQIIESRHNGLHSIVQIEEAFLLLTECTAEAAEFRRRNGSITLDHASCDFLLKRIAEQKGIERKLLKLFLNNRIITQDMPKCIIRKQTKRQNESI